VEPARQEHFLAAHSACHDKVYRFFRRRAGDPSAAEDLCAEVFRIAWEKCRQDQELSVLIVFGIARNVLRNHNRSAVRSMNLAQQLERQQTREPVSDDGEVRDALDRLKPEDREVLLLTYWDGFTSAEVAELLDVSATAGYHHVVNSEHEEGNSVDRFEGRIQATLGIGRTGVLR